MLSEYLNLQSHTGVLAVAKGLIGSDLSHKNVIRPNLSGGPTNL